MDKHEKILKDMKDKGQISEDHFSELIGSFNIVVDKKVNKVIEEQKERENILLEEEKKLSNDLIKNFDSFIEEERKLAKEEILNNEQEVIDEEIQKINDELVEENNEFKKELYEKVISMIDNYMEDEIIPNIDSDIIEEQYNNIVEESKMKDDAINVLKRNIKKNKKLIEESKVIEERKKKMNESIEINNIVEEECNGLTSSEKSLVKKQVEGRDINWVEENIEEVVDAVIEESINFKDGRKSNINNMFVDESKYDAEKQNEQKSIFGPYRNLI